MHKKILKSLLLGSILITPIYAHANSNINDISEHWAKKEINQFISSGYVNGYEDGTFRPDNSITRAEFVKLVNKYFGFNNKGDMKFSDINTNDWYYKDICIASKAGYINGYEDKTFRPNKTITRQEVCKILISIKNKKDNIYDKLNKYPDKNKVSNWANPYVEGAIEQGYLKGNDLGFLNPTNNITRAESITILSRVSKEKSEIKNETKNEAPLITANENLTIEVGQKFDMSMLNVKVSDKEDTNLDVKYEGKVNTDLAGNYTITITATDSKELTTTKKVTVVVKEKPEIKNEPPVITAIDLTINQGDKFEYNLLNAHAKDAEGKNITQSIIYSGNVNTSKPGKYPIILTVKDDKGIPASLKVKVIVKSINKLPINNKNKFMLQKILDDKTSNIKVHKDEYGSIDSYDIFLKGVTPPSDSDYTVLKEYGYTTPVAPYKQRMGWYDANKVFNDAGDGYLCSGAVASNILNWWMDQNSDYINRYLNFHGKNSTCINEIFGISQNATISNFRKNPDDLFKYITKCFKNTNNKGISPDKTLFWFLNGHDLNYRFSENKKDTRGGFFPDVFDDYSSIIDQIGCFYFSDLNYYLLDSFHKNKGMGISYESFGSEISSHIISLWGAKFDTNGNLLGVFISDSDDGGILIDNKSDKTYGMIYRNVVKEINTNKARLTNKVTPKGDIGARILYLYTLDTGKSIWENYFKSIK